MKNLFKLSQLVLTSLLIIAFVYSCDNKDEDLDIKNLATKSLIEQIKNASNKQQILKAELPDNSETTIKTDYAGSYVNKANHAPKLGYEVKMAKKYDNATQEIYFDIEGNELKTESMDNFDESEYNEEYKDFEDDFKFIYPINMTMPDNSTLVLNEEADWDKVEKWYDDNPEITDFPKINYPIEVKLGEETKTINSEEELEALFDSYFDDMDSIDYALDFEFIYPITCKMPDNTSIVIEKDADWFKIDDWFYKNFQVLEYEEIVFPIQIKKDGETININNQEELDTHEKYNTADDFEFIYPLSYTMPDNTTITVNEKYGWADFVNWYTQNPDNEEEAKLNYPITVKLSDGNSKTINNDEELDQLLELDYDDYDYSENDFDDMDS